MSYRVGNYVNNNSRFLSAADNGGRRILGMNGSLTAYIRTGDAYNKDYYVGSSNSRHAKKRKINIPDIVQYLGIMSAIIGGAFLYKTGKVDLKNLYTSLSTKVKSLKPISLKGCFSKVKNFGKNIFKKPSLNFDFKKIKNNLGTGLKNIGTKIKNVFKKP